MLVLHSFHFLNLTNSTRKPEVYAREIGIQLERLNRANVVVKESPRKRSFDDLLKKYHCDWIVDLHDVAREYRSTIDNSPDGRKLLAILGSQQEMDGKLAQFVQKNNYPVGTMPISPAYHPRYIVAELYPWIPKFVTIDFLSMLLQFVKSDKRS